MKSYLASWTSALVWFIGLKMTWWITCNKLKSGGFQSKRTLKRYHIHICIWLRIYIYTYVDICIHIYNYIHVDRIYWIHHWFCGYQPRLWMGIQDGREWQSGKVVPSLSSTISSCMWTILKTPKISSSCLSVCTILKISETCFCRKFPNEKKSGRSWKQPWSQWLGVGRKISKSKKLRRTLSWFFLQDYVVGHKSVSRKCWESKNLRI